MARGFGATFGVGTTDLITLAYNTHNIICSYHALIWINGAGGGTLGRVFDTTSGAIAEQINLTTTATIEYQRSYGAGGTGEWAIGAPATGAFHSFGVSINSTSFLTDPIIYLDGTPTALTIDNNPIADPVDVSTVAFTLGNRASDSARNWDGKIAEFAAWNVVLTAAEFTLLSGGLSALCVHPSSLLSYVSLTDAPRDSVFGGSITTTGTALQTHPVIKRPYLYADLSGRTQPMAGGING